MEMLQRAKTPARAFSRACTYDCRTAEQKTVRNWDDASCIMQSECRPHLIGIKESTMVSTQQPTLTTTEPHGPCANEIHAFALSRSRRWLAGWHFCNVSTLRGSCACLAPFRGRRKICTAFLHERVVHPVQATLDGVELYDAVHWAVHIVHSETVAVNGCNIWGDQLIPNSGGIAVDGSRRVYLGGNIISTADNAITVKTTSGDLIRDSIGCFP